MSGREWTDDERRAFRLSDPDPVGLMNVIELIAPQARVTGWSRLAGGIGGAMHRVEVTMPSGATTAFVLRRPNPWHSSPALVLREAETLEKLRPTHVPAPELLWVDPDGAAFGVPALAMTLLPGDPSVATEDPSAWGRQLAEPLAGIHLLPAEMVDHLPTVSPAGALDEVLSWHRDAGEEHLPAGRIRQALRAGVEDLEAPQVRLCHGDYHGGQVLRREDGTVTGVVDWAQAHVGDPRSDVAYCHYDTSLLHGEEAADAFVDRYVTLTGRELTDAWWWQLLAVASSLPDPAVWGAAMADAGGPVTDDLMRRRSRAYTDRLLEQAGA